MPRFPSFLFSLLALLALTGCGGKEPERIHFYAAASMTDAVSELALTDDRKQAMTTAMIKTLPGCVTAATTTAAAFLALAISDFRGFREYGLIASMGVLVTLVVTFICLPPLAMMLGRVGKSSGTMLAQGRFHLRMAWPMVIIGIGLMGLSLFVAPDVSWNSNFRKLRGFSDTVDFSEEVAEQLGGSLSPAAILVKDLDQARTVERYFKSLKSDKNSQVRSTLSLVTLIPEKVEQKLPILKQIQLSLEEALEGDLKKEDQKRVKEALKLAQVQPWTVDDIPSVFSKQFRTIDNKGQFVIVWPKSKMFQEPEIIAWGNELNMIRSDLHELGIPVKIMDENRLAARVLSRMRADAPYMIISAAFAVLVILIIGFRSGRAGMLVAGSLLFGVSWMMAVMYRLDLEINVFNQAILPTIIGLGIDNAVHILHRYHEEGPGSLPKVVATTGTASFLATATTTIGFGAAVTAHHYGVQSLGWLAIVGLTCTFVSSTIFFPAVLRLLEQRKMNKKAMSTLAS